MRGLSSWIVPGSLVVLFLAPTTARAHGEVAAGRRVFVQGGQVVGGEVTYGWLFLDGQTPLWTAEEALTEGTPHAQVIKWSHYTRDGRLLAGTFSGLHVSTDYGCSWTEIEGVAVGHHIPGFSVSPTDPARLYASTSSGAGDNGVLISEDEGRTWRKVDPGRPDTPFYKRIVATTTALLVDGNTLETQERFLVRSFDGGESWSAAPLDLSGYRDIRLVGRSSDGSTAFLAAEPADAAGTQILLASTDGFDTARTLGTFGDPDAPKRIDAVTDFAGRYFVILDNDRLVSGPEGGPFEPVDGGPSRCLDPDSQPGVLWGCGQLRDRFHFLSTADGTRWEGQVAYEDVLPRTCPEGTPGAEANATNWGDVRSLGVGRDPGGEPDGGGADGAAPGEVPPAGCCTASTARGPAGLVALVLLFGALRPPRRRWPRR